MTSLIQRINTRIAQNEPLQQFINFGIVGAAGAALNTFVLYILTLYTPLHYLVAAAIATQLAIISNFVGNHTATFSKMKNGTSLTRKFLTFQAVSLFGLGLTLTTLWTLTTLFGIKYLLIWNLFAILVTFAANFLLNRYFTWGTEPFTTKRAMKSVITKLTILFIALGALAAAAHAETVAVSQLGYHPSAEKQVVVYTSQTTGTYTVGDISGTLARPVDANGNPTNCQGNNPCLVGDFSALTTPGTYSVTTSFGNSPSFTVSPDVYLSASAVLTQYFDAEKMQGSPFHPDMNTQQQPPLPAVADGSFIMTADQAALATIRLGSAYRRNPVLAGGKVQDTIQTYVAYLEGLQGATVTAGGDTRLRFGTYQLKAFTPGTVTQPTIDVYNPQGAKITTVNVTSLCGADAECINNAINLYKCQLGEVCLDVTYNDITGTVTNNGGYAVSRGWIYDWSCFLDSDSATFTTRNNPCLIFDASVNDPESGESYVSKTFLAYLEAIPALSQSQQEALYERAVHTYEFMQSNPDTHNNPSENGYYGAGLFLLYDYTNDPKYLQEAHSLSGSVEQDLVADHTRGSEFYWEEYGRHKAAIMAAGLTYANGEDKYIGKMFHDWSGKGFDSIANNGERVFQFDNNVQFSNSRFILTEGLQAAKTLDLVQDPQDFMKTIADNQISWITGMNGVQQGVAEGSPVGSYSFILGIGNHPTEMHSRFLAHTGLSSASGGALVGAHGMEYQWKDPSGNFIWFDGRTTILGVQFGALGNGYNGETQVEPFTPGRTFSNGMSIIPGWINGAYDTKFQEDDVIFNYVDKMKDFTYTESTNEIVATAIEYVAYLDAQKNGRPRAPVPHFGTIDPPAGTATLTITSTPALADTVVDGTAPRITPAVYVLAAGSHQVYVGKQGYNSYEEVLTLAPDENRVLPVVLTENSTVNSTGTATLDLTTVPPEALLFIDNVYSGTTDAAGRLVVAGVSEGTHNIHVTKTNYNDYLQDHAFADGETKMLTVTLTPMLINASDAVIVTDTTSLTKHGSNHYMLENASATFGVTTDKEATVTWTVEYTQHPDDGGKQVSLSLGTTTGTTHSIAWDPTVLITSKLVTVTVSATTGADTQTWTVDVEDVINPFWSGDFGATEATLHIYTHDALLGTANTVTAVLTGKSGPQTVTLFNGFNNSRESDWRQTISDMPEGTTYVTQVTVSTNSNKTYTFDIPSVVGHYRTETTSSSGERSSPRRNSRGSGTGGRAANFPPMVVYALFEKDIVGAEEKQTLRLDARDDLIVKRVVATILGPEGYRAEELELVDGAAGYGTWEATFGDLEPGQYKLEAVTLWDQMPDPTERNVTASFYVVDDATAAAETLGLVYTVIDKSRVQANSTVTLTLDARDVLGIEEVYATGRTNRNATNFTFPLTMVSGTPQYGTWSGNFTLTEPDTTYTITTVYLSNGNETKNYTLKDRSIYVAAIPGRANARGDAEQVPFFSKENMRSLLKKPLIPTTIGFIVMLAIIAVVTLNSELRGKFRKSLRR